MKNSCKTVAEVMNNWSQEYLHQFLEKKCSHGIAGDILEKKVAVIFLRNWMKNSWKNRLNKSWKNCSNNLENFKLITEQISWRKCRTNSWTNCRRKFLTHCKKDCDLFRLTIRFLSRKLLGNSSGNFRSNYLRNFRRTIGKFPKGSIVEFWKESSESFWRNCS